MYRSKTPAPANVACAAGATTAGCISLFTVLPDVQTAMCCVVISGALLQLNENHIRLAFSLVLVASVCGFAARHGAWAFFAFESVAAAIAAGYVLAQLIRLIERLIRWWHRRSLM